jgi:hypothetical protein
VEEYHSTRLNQRAKEKNKTVGLVTATVFRHGMREYYSTMMMLLRLHGGGFTDTFLLPMGKTLLLATGTVGNCSASAECASLEHFHLSFCHR